MPDAAPAPAPAAGAPTPAGESTDDIINDILSQQKSQRSEEGRNQPARAEREARPEARREAADEADDASADGEGDAGDDEGDEAVERAQKPGKHDDDYSDVDDLSAEDRLAQAAEALEKGDLKKALRLALKIRPEALKADAGKFTALRLAQQRERQKTAAQVAQLNQQRQQFTGEVNQWINRLKPYEPYHDAGERYKQTGDPGLLVQIICGLTNTKDYNDAQKIILHNQHRNPAQVRMQQELEELRLRDQQREQERQRQHLEQTTAAQRAADISHIKTVLKAHPVAKIPKFEERVYKVLSKHVDPNLGLTITVEEAARRVVRAEKKRIESSPFYRKGTVETQGEARTEPKTRASSPALRRDSQNNGAPAGEESNDDIINDIVGQIQRQQSVSGQTRAPRVLR